MSNSIQAASAVSRPMPRGRLSISVSSGVLAGTRPLDSDTSHDG
jgi:hypothetical protein